MNHREVAQQIVASVTETRYITPEGYSDVLAKESALVDAIESALISTEREAIAVEQLRRREMRIAKHLLHPFAYIAIEFLEAMRSIRDARSRKAFEVFESEHESPCSVYLSSHGFCVICSNRKYPKQAKEKK